MEAAPSNATPRALDTGALVANKYRVVSLLGAGGMGSVYRVQSIDTGDPAALKVLRSDRSDLALRLRREARILSALDHPNIARVREVVTLDDDSPAIVMDLLEGESLATTLRRSPKLDVRTVARVGLAIARAVVAAHARGVVHRDLKPDNVLMCDDGEVKILDFGIAKVMLDSRDPAITAAPLTETGQIIGTPQYMAPEQIFGEADIDGRADVWALGVILYQAVSGQRPFDGENPGQIFKAIALEPLVSLDERAPFAPRRLRDLVSRMLVHSRDDRLADLEVVVLELERVREDHALEHAPTVVEDASSVAMMAGRWLGASSGPARSSSRWITVAAAMGLAVVTVGLGALLKPAPAVSVGSRGALTAPASVGSPSSPESSRTPTPELLDAGAPPIVRVMPAPPATIPTRTVSTARDAGVDGGPRRSRSGGLSRDEF